MPKNNIPYIYVEKPAFGIEEYFKSYNFSKYNLKFLQVGYQYNYSQPINDLKKIIETNSNGNLLRLDIFWVKVLPLKRVLENEWRSKQKEAIAETLDVIF